MKLIKIELNNFRQFYGHQAIEFASGNENITIVFGENGKGKTGVFRALMFGLYGSTHIQQDNPREKIHLVNFLMLDESPNMPVEASVKILFEYNDKRYELLRTVVGVKMGNSIEERAQGVQLNVIDELGNYNADPIVDAEKISRIINDILHENIKDFFLFDAERIETLGRTDKKVKEEVKTGIIKLLNIDQLEKGIRILRTLYQSENRRLSESSQRLDLNQKQNEIDQLNKKIQEVEEIISLKEENKSACVQEIEDIEIKLAENEEVKRIQEKYNNALEKKNTELRFVQTKKEEIKKDLIEKGPRLLMKDTFHSVKTYLEQILVDQQDLIPIEVIEKSLREGECMCCGTDISANEKQLKHVQMLKSSFKRSSLTPLISMISSSIHDTEVEEDDMMTTIQNQLTEFRELKNNVDTYDQELQAYQDQVVEKAQERENLRHFESTLKTKKQYSHDLGVEIENKKNELFEAEKELKKAEKDFSSLVNQDKSLRVDAKALEYIDQLKSNFEHIVKEYSEEMREKLTDEATTIFNTIIDRKDKSLINRIRITEKYEIDVIGWGNVNITQDISQGQRQVVALSFITALAKIAAGNQGNINFPLFMDTPFGRISGNNRDQLIQNIPNLTSQWVLLLTDTELSRAEELQFKTTGKLGKWYKLEQVKNGHSNIVEVDINEAIATRG